MPEPLIPEQLRVAYEKLIEEGSRLLPVNATSTDDHQITTMMSEIGLALVEAHIPPILLPTDPDAAFARILARWHAAIVDTRDRIMATMSTAIRFERTTIRTAIRHSTKKACLLVSSWGQVVTLHYGLTFSADHRCRQWETGPYRAPITLPTGELHPVESLYFAPELRKRGVEHIIIYDSPFLDEQDGPEDMAAGYADGEEIRLLQEKLPMKLLIIDDDTALVPLGPHGYPCLFIRDKALVDVFVKFFELKWAEAKPWAPPGTPIVRQANTQRRRTLAALAAGLKDEAIARQQGVSVRTVRRHIEAIMGELGVKTRFAAGVAAVRRGWLNSAA